MERSYQCPRPAYRIDIPIERMSRHYTLLHRDTAVWRKIVLDHSHVAYWIIIGVMWLTFGFAIRLLFLCTKDMLKDIKKKNHFGADIAQNLSIML